jgi:hypothetical protein
MKYDSVIMKDGQKLIGEETAVVYLNSHKLVFAWEDLE